MIDKTLRTLWQTKDDIAKEHGYDLDALVAYLQTKAKTRGNDFLHVGQTTNAEQGTPADARTSRG